MLDVPANAYLNVLHKNTLNKLYMTLNFLIYEYRMVRNFFPNACELATLGKMDIVLRIAENF